jgi:protein-L-isoaspartate O-methyltransferase
MRMAGVKEYSPPCTTATSRYRMNDRDIAASIYREFRAKPESQFIASEFALFHLAEFLSTHRINSALEIGAGIGTITKLMLSHKCRPENITSTESHPLCIRELEKNLARVDKRGWRLLGGISEFSSDEAFDLVIFDGTLGSDLQYSLIGAGTWCFVEGDRSGTRTALANYLENSGLTIDMQSIVSGRSWLWRTILNWLLGIQMPRLQVGHRKGCHIGQVVPLQR